MKNIHPTAIVHPDALLADGVVIGPYAIIGKNVNIGENTEVMAHAIVEGFTTIGKNNKIYPSASIGLPCQDLKYKGEPTKLIIGDNNHLREFCTLHPSATTDEDTLVGNNNLIMAYAHIAHNCQIGNNVILSNAVQLAGHVHVHDFAIIGGVTAVHQFVRVGTHAFVGGASGLRKDIPPFTRGQGMDRYRIAGINSVGLLRKGFSQETIEALVSIFKVFYLSKMNITQAINFADSMTDLIDEQKIFIDFCKQSTRGINRNKAD
ncbi:MAG: acyl-ACP--UDP-N-acetylglucosamine O-acyltransferase [Candidatus Cloacimonetes bacterium]|nr:acyl-ACP--UDP-N-acetylglucosamine O-acyltransferase [Candidatus Cloacimonadota bacterium]